MHKERCLYHGRHRENEEGFYGKRHGLGGIPQTPTELSHTQCNGLLRTTSYIFSFFALLAWEMTSYVCKTNVLQVSYTKTRKCLTRKRREDYPEMEYKYESISFRTTQEDKRKLEAMAESKRISTSVLIRDIIHHYVNYETPQIKQMDEMMKRLDTIAYAQRIDEVKDELLRYLQQILYHGFRTDMWNIQYAKKVHKDTFAQELDQEVEDLAKKQSA